MSTARIVGVVAAVALGWATVPQLATASTLLFSFTGPDGMASWFQSSAPTPIYYILGDYTDVPVAATGPDSFGYAFSDVDFYPPYNYGGFTIGNNDIQEAGAPEYTGDESAPLFAPGVYPTDTYGPTGPGAFGDTGIPGGVLTITVVPEPPVWLILGLGLGALGLSLRASRKGARLAV